jgi:hypothetical protein
MSDWMPLVAETMVLWLLAALVAWVGMVLAGHTPLELHPTLSRRTQQRNDSGRRRHDAQ